MKKMKKIKKFNKKPLPKESLAPEKKLKEKVKYAPMQCKFIKENKKRCKKFACGESTLCEHHGGSVVIKSNLTPTNELTKQQLSIAKFNPSKHPLKYIELSQQGLNKIEIAAEFGVSTITLTHWSQKYEEMNTAIEIGENMNIAWWLKEGKENLDNNRYNTGMFKFLTGNTLGFSDKIEQKNTNTNIHGVLVVPDKMTPSEWKEKARLAMEKQDAIEAEFMDSEE